MPSARLLTTLLLPPHISWLRRTFHREPQYWLNMTDHQSRSQTQNQRQPRGAKHAQKQGGRGGGSNPKLRGLPKDSPDVRLSKTLSWLLRHGAESEGLMMRSDGYVRVDDLMTNKRLQPLGLTLEKLQEIVKADAKQRYTLTFEAETEGSAAGSWLLKANQGHSLKTVELDLKPILHVSDIPTGTAVHGTTFKAWEVIQKEGLSKMKRNHIHFAQGRGGENVISGIRKTSQVFIFVDVQKALDVGIKFFLSENGVVLTEGDEGGYMKPEFFLRVEDSKGVPLKGWEGASQVLISSTTE